MKDFFTKLKTSLSFRDGFWLAFSAYAIIILLVAAIVDLIYIMKILW